jgi:hypothetical protein
VFIPEGTFNVTGPILMRDGVRFLGAGPEATILSFSGTNTHGFRPATPGTRTYDQGIAQLTIKDAGTGTTAVELDSVSTSEFVNVIVSGWTYGVNLYSPTNGYSVYNRLHHVSANNCDTGFVCSGEGTNAHIFVGCRYNGTSTTGTKAFDIDNANGCQFIGTHIDFAQAGWTFTATNGAGYTDGNVIIASRIENVVDVFHLAANVRYMHIGWNCYVAITGNHYVDQGTRNNIDDPPRLWRKDFAGVPSASGDVRFLRSVDGTDKPFVVLRDSVNASSPITLQVETESGAGVFVKGRRGSSDYFRANADGSIAIRDGIPAPAAISGMAVIFVDSSDGDLKVRFGDGTVKTIVVDT